MLHEYKHEFKSALKNYLFQGLIKLKKCRYITDKNLISNTSSLVYHSIKKRLALVNISEIQIGSENKNISEIQIGSENKNISEIEFIMGCKR